MNRGIYGLTILAIALSSGPTFAEDGTTPTKIAVGDKWVYQETDTITNSPTRKNTDVVTEVSDKDYTVHGTTSDGKQILDIFDYNGNGIQFGPSKYSTNNGQGLPDNAKSGTKWKKTVTWKNTEKGNGGKENVTGECTGNESVTVPAGTFDALKCTIHVSPDGASGATKPWETEFTTWESPQVLRWVKREITRKQQGHVAEKKSIELTEYNLK